MERTIREVKQLMSNYKTIKGGFWGRYDDFKIKKANELISKGIEVLPIVPNTNGEIDSFYMNYQKNPKIASINNKWDLERFFCDMNRNVGYIENGWLIEFIIVDNLDKYQEVIIKKYKIDGGLYETL